MPEQDIPYRAIAEAICLVVTTIASFLAGQRKGKKTSQKRGL